MSSPGLTISDTNKYLNNHNIMMFFAVLFLIIAFVWLIGLSGVQTGSSTASGFGSIFASSLTDVGTTNPTYEVVAEFFIAMFLILGIAMFTYVVTVKKSAQKLIEKGDIVGAFYVNGGKEITPDAMTQAQKDTLKAQITLLGLPTTVISDGLKYGQEQVGRGTDYIRGSTQSERERDRMQKQIERDRIQVVKDELKYEREERDKEDMKIKNDQERLILLEKLKI
jgi:hypothetical protein